MPLVSRKVILAIAAVIDIAINSCVRPVSAKALAAGHRLPPRHLEPMLQALVHFGILKGICGPHGGYELAREDRAISAEDVLRAAGSADEANEAGLPGSALVDDVMWPLLADAERALLETLARINVEDMTRRTESVSVLKP